MTYHGLVAKFGSAIDAVAEFPEFSTRLRRKAPKDLVSQSDIEQEVERLSDLGGQILSMEDASYPKLLKEITDAPPYLSVLGDPAHFDIPAIGIVGARNASLNGKKFAQSLALDLAAAGYSVLSGLARGIDTAAHKGAIDRSTVAVMAGGVDVVYPRQNTDLYKAIIERGAVVSEMPLGQDPQAHHFPRRNRIISGSCVAVVVVEGTPKSGSLITARLALDQGRDVFAVPGSPLDPRAEGPNTLIREGAGLVRSADDILQEIGHMKQLKVDLILSSEDHSQTTEI